MSLRDKMRRCASASWTSERSSTGRYEISRSWNGLPKQQLGPAHEQEAPVPQREVEAAEHLALGLAGEVHDGVPAHEEIDARDRRVLDEIVTAENDRAPEVLVEEIAVVDALEIPREKFRRNVLDLLRRVG